MYAASLNCIADFYFNFRDKLELNNALEKGNFYLKKAIKSIDKKKNLSNYIQFKFNKAKYYRYSKQFKKAFKENLSIINLAEKEDQRIPFFIAQKGLIFLDSGEKEKALTAFSNMVGLIHSDSTKLAENFSNFKPSTVLNHTGLLVEIADEILKKYPKDSVLKSRIANYYKIGLKQFKNCYQSSNFNAKLKEYYHKAIKGILQTSSKKVGSKKTKEIINTIENLENRFAWKAFKQNRKLLNSGIPDSIFNKETVYRNQLVDARKNKDKQQILEANNQLEKYYNELKENYPKVFKYIYSDFDVTSLQKNLDENSIIFRYKKINDLLYVFKINKNSVSVEQIKFGEPEKKMIENYIKALRDKKEDKTEATLIYKLLFPFSLKDKKSIVIIPDDILHHLPFETLVRKDRYLVSDFNINYSAYLVFLNKNTANTQTNTIHLYSPLYNSLSTETTRKTIQKLDGAKKEVEAISKLFKSKAFMHKEATKTKFLNQVTTADILHLAMHAKINNENPELSHFLFSSLETDKLYLEELYGLQVKAKLAVLSACNTGTSFFNNYSGSVSLQRAFTLAGVPSTVSSLWEVPDEATKTIMVNFYKHLKEGLSKPEALQKAKIDYIKNTNDINFTAPYYWAGFVVSGDETAIILKENSYWLYRVLLILAIILVVSIQRFQKR